ncbi:type II toxin-antitoxin system RelE/ParE family toxin [Rhizobium sp. AAP43]|uniref:type II toxin-antitoxin system RelE/ParE family toxin n=1 Tax=Rhizobium sp. AAP43 TaxID=1523420 RepID=UPI0006B9F5B5|nr:type II toxin-antitoxin system RelE/ParE family toxin [Rhizobium sp. AAP43]KPF46873.1 plasmid stabilization protein [Rhizobium sp. AAP43]
MKRRLHYSDIFFRDMQRYYRHLASINPQAADKAYDAVAHHVELLVDFPMIGRRVQTGDEAIMLRELIVPFGSSGYIILFEVVDDETLSVLAIRHQREEDYD